MSPRSAAAVPAAAGVLALAAAMAGCIPLVPGPADAGFADFADRFLPPPGPAADSGTFVLVEDADTFALERFRHGRARLETDLLIRSQVHVQTVASLREDGSVRRVEFRLFPPGDDVIFQSSAADFARDSLRLEEPIGAVVTRDAFPHPVVPEVDLSAAYLELILRRARTLERDRAPAPAPDGGTARPAPIVVPVWRPGAGIAVDTALVTFDDDRATLLIRDTGYRAHTDATGRLLSAVAPHLALLIHRR